MKILVTGGAGYVGSVLVPELLKKGYEVRVLDNLMYGQTSLFAYFMEGNFKFIKGDVRDVQTVEKAVDGVDMIIHLAAIVGAPVCEKNPELAKSVNDGATKLLSSLLSKNQQVIYSSTGSNYGAVIGQICTEETPLNPFSIYGVTKTEAEKYLMENNNTIAFRFATAFGVSPRMRLDLLINDFVYQAVVNKTLILFEKTFKRTFIHVGDMARSFIFGLKNFDRMKGQIYNVGGEKNNFSKEDVALKIKEKIKFYLHFADIGEDQDKRNYIVSYKKINEAGFKIKISVDEGINELIRAVPAMEYRNPYKNV